jgi:D-alanyl-D-alanine carboxypeptidase
MRPTTISIIALAALAPLPAQAQADFRAQAAALLDASYPADAPGAAALVLHKGKLIFAGARGLADLQGRRLTPDTPIRLGSVTKQFTAALVLQLVAEKRIALDDPLSRFFPDWPAPTNRATVRQLLNHTSGIMDFTKIPGWMLSPPSLRPNSTADLVALTRSKPAVSEPGTRWEYNNGGYMLLGAIIEQVTGRSWHQAIVDRIARPLGLRTIAYAGDAIPATARGYSRQGDAYLPAAGVHISVAHAAGGLVGSADDLARWAQALHHGRVVTPALYREMTTPARLADGSTQPYGFGLRLRAMLGKPAYVHGGAGRGLDADSVYVPSEDLYVVVLANTDDPQTDPSVLTRRLAALAMGSPIPSFTRADVDLASLEPLFGAYSAESGPPRRFFARGGKLYVGRGDEEREVFAAGADRFFFGPGDLAWFRILRKADGMHVLEAHDPEAAAPLTARRTGAVPQAFAVAPAVLKGYVGTYKTEGPTVKVALAADGSLTIAGPNGEANPMRPVSDTEFRVEGTPMRLVFHPEGGKTDRLTLHRGARELHGKREGP